MEERGNGQDGAAYDGLTAALRELRTERGHPSFNDLVLRITEVRMARGMPREAARPGRTTVYDAFRAGRTRIDPLLVGDIARALGESEEAAREWERRCRDARRRAETRPVSQPRVDPATAEPVTEPEGVPGRAADEPSTSTDEDESLSPQVPGAWSFAPWQRLGLLLLLGVCVNLLGRLVVVGLDLPLHQDMVGTAIAAFLGGPWTAVAVAVVTATLGTVTNGLMSLDFLPVSVAGALVLGYGFHRFRCGGSAGRIFQLGMVTAVICTLVAVPILLAYGGTIGRSGEQTVEIIQGVTGHLATAVFVTNLVYSLIDKLLSVFVAMAVLDLARARAESWTGGHRPRSGDGAAVVRVQGGSTRPDPG